MGYGVGVVLVSDAGRHGDAEGLRLEFEAGVCGQFFLEEEVSHSAGAGEAQFAEVEMAIGGVWDDGVWWPG